MCKNVFTINNGIIVLTFHELHLTKGHGRGLHGPESDARPVPCTARDFSNGLGRAGKCKSIFTNERRFLQLAGPAIERFFCNGPGWDYKKEMSSGWAGPGAKNFARVNL